MALLGGLLLAGASGCNTYKYFEIHASFDPTTLQSNMTGVIKDCFITVSGADSDRFRLNHCPPPSSSTAPLDIGTFEFATFADSGTLTFQFDGFAGMAQMPRCTIATGKSMPIAVTGETTISGNLVAAAPATPPASDCFAVSGGM
jgi:hypothetical protein